MGTRKTSFVKTSLRDLPSRQFCHSYKLALVFPQWIVRSVFDVHIQRIYCGKRAWSASKCNLSVFPSVVCLSIHQARRCSWLILLCLLVGVVSLCSGVLLSMLCALDTLSNRLRCCLSDAVGLEASKFTHKWEPEMQICDTLRVSLWIWAFSLPEVIQLLLLSALFFFLPSLIVI